MKIRAEQLQGSSQKAAVCLIYVISGDEPLLLLRNAADAMRIRGAARAQGFTMSANYFILPAGRILRLESRFINESSATSLLFADKKSSRSTNSQRQARRQRLSKALSELCANPNPDNLVLLVICAEAGPRRTKQQVDENSGRPPAPIFRSGRWMPNRCRAGLDSVLAQRRHITASPEAVQILADRVEGNLLAAVQEIEKLKLLAPDGTCRRQHYVIGGR